MSDKFELNENVAACESIKDEDVRKAFEADKGKDAKFISFKVVNFARVGDNYASFVTSVEVEYSMNEEKLSESYIVKLNPLFKVSNAVEFVNKMFTNEYMMFSKLFPLLDGILISNGQTPLRVPKYLYGCIDKGHEKIFFEDMRKKGYKMYDRLKGIDEAHGTLVLKEVARLHASSNILFNDKEKEEIFKEFSFLEDFFSKPEFDHIVKEWMAPSITNGASILSKCASYEKVAGFVSSLTTNITESLRSLMKSNKTFSVVNHGDCWNNNMIFRYEDEKPVEVCLLDFQVPRYASMGIDLNYFFYSSFNGGDRKANLDHFMSTYFKEFENCIGAAGLAMPFTKDQLLEEYRSKHMYGLIMGIGVTPPVILSQFSDLPKMTEMTDENMKEMLEKWQLFLGRMVKESPLLRPRFLDMFDEMVEAGVIKF